MINYLREIKKVYGYKMIFKLSIVISFIVIFLDIINFFTKLIEIKCLWLLFLGVSFFIIKLLNKKMLKMFILKSVSSLDVILNSMIFSEIVIFLYLFTTFKNNNYKFTIMYILLVATILCIIIRIILTNNKNIENKKTIYDLQELYSNEVNIEKGDIILLEEKDVDYDLLDRKSIINQLFNTIINCYPARTFTIGLDGQWGSGKTTIINNVLNLIKKNKIEDSFVIVKFDPWEYDNEKALLKGLIDQILIKMNLNMEIENMDSLVDSVIDVIFFESKSSISHIIKSEIENVQSKIKIENIINNYLNKQNKRMILVIDNLDRIDADKVKFMLKIISSTLNFKNTINILLYDNNIIENELDKCFGTVDLNRKYMEKIVQLKINIPQIDSNIVEDIKNKISNNLTYDNEPILKKLFGSNIKFDNIRELKRFINYVLSSLMGMPTFLNTCDLVNLEYIRSENSNLYYEIWKNKTFYISDDRKYDLDLYTLDYKNQNKLAKEYFKQLFSCDENKEFLETLALLFPNVKRFKDDVDIFNINYRNPEQYQGGIKENRIYNTRYFDLYFTKNSNDFIRINNDVSSIIKTINSSRSEKKIIDEYKNITLDYNFDESKVFMEVLEINLEKIDKSKYFVTLIALYKYLNNLSNVPMFFEIDSKQRCEIIISKLLNEIPIDKLDLFCKKILDEYKNIHSISQILYWMENDNNKNNENICKLRETYNKQCQDIIDNKIDLYSDKNYIYGNIWGLYQYDKEKTINYVSNIINEKNIYRFLNDIISHSVGTGGYGYSLKKSNIDAIAPNINIDNLIDKHISKLSADEEFIKEIYNLYKKTTTENSFEDSIYTTEYKLIKNI